MKSPYKYAVIRIVPRADRDEFINAGVILFHPAESFLRASTLLREPQLRALNPSVDIDQVQRHLRGIERICAGDPSAGPMARMKKSDRFHWLTSPRSTMIQTSPVRTGLTDSAEREVEQLARELVS